MFFNCLVNFIQYGNIGDPGAFTFLAVTTFLMLLGDLLVALTIYIPKERFREHLLIRYSVWPSLTLILSLSAVFLVANFDGVILMEQYNEAYKDTHGGRNWYECSVWSSRFVIAIIGQASIGISWFIYTRRYYEWHC